MHVGVFMQFALHICTRSCRILRQWNAGRFKFHWKPICRTDRHLGLNNSFLKQSYQCFFILYLSVNNGDLTSSALPIPYHKTVRCSLDFPFPSLTEVHNARFIVSAAAFWGMKPCRLENASWTTWRIRISSETSVAIYDRQGIISPKTLILVTKALITLNFAGVLLDFLSSC
jgi:hypothetical protein